MAIPVRLRGMRNLAIDLANDKLHIAIKSTEFRNMYKLWSEPGAQVPAALRRAMQQASP